jgi:hypothetical protein
MCLSLKAAHAFNASHAANFFASSSTELARAMKLSLHSTSQGRKIGAFNMFRRQCKLVGSDFGLYAISHLQPCVDLPAKSDLVATPSPDF